MAFYLQNFTEDGISSSCKAALIERNDMKLAFCVLAVRSILHLWMCLTIFFNSNYSLKWELGFSQKDECDGLLNNWISFVKFKHLENSSNATADAFNQSDRFLG